MDMLRAWGKGHDITDADLIKAAAVGGVGAPKEFGDDKSYRNFVDMLMRRAARLDIRQE